jgi:hypothetical protein
MMIRSKKNKLEKIEDRKYRLKRWGVIGELQKRNTEYSGWRYWWFF